MEPTNLEKTSIDREEVIIIADTRKWVETLVTGLNLCPFAKRELTKNRIRFVVSDAANEEALLLNLHSEMLFLQNNESVETTLLIHPKVLTAFADYNEFLADADYMLTKMDLEGVLQIASFHPDYQFAGTAPGDVENYTNRSPYPMLHLLREDSLEQAIDNYPDADLIPDRNIALLKSMGLRKVQALYKACFHL